MLYRQPADGGGGREVVVWQKLGVITLFYFIV